MDGAVPSSARRAGRRSDPKGQAAGAGAAASSSSGCSTSRAASALIDFALFRIATFGFGSLAALIVSLPPGSYTAQVSGVNNTTGVALIEVYDLP